jgi:hypothetical protein
VDLDAAEEKLRRGESRETARQLPLALQHGSDREGKREINLIQRRQDNDRFRTVVDLSECCSINLEYLWVRQEEASKPREQVQQNKS